MKLYKLTTQDGLTRKGEDNETKWGDGVERTASGEGDLCGPGWLHAYEDPLVAAFMNPAHANITSPLLWECDGGVGKREGELKCGCTRLKTLRQIPLPQITTDQRVEVAIRVARGILKQLNVVIEAWDSWADKWLDGTDRTAHAAYAADAAHDATAAYATYAATAATAARAATYAARAAANVATAANAANDVSLICILHQVVDGEVSNATA